ncbi:MAG: SixA phosphatase family protein [Elsteraceae bacterium]
MKTVLLLRHGKSGWGDPSLDDHERPLAPRGVAAAKAIGRLLRERGWIPERVMCSSARRTQETLSELRTGFGDGLPEASVEPCLYLASADGLIDRLRSLPDDVASAMVIGHNDGMHLCALRLVGHAEPSELAKLESGFPTAGLAVIAFDVAHWAAVGDGGGSLLGLVFPREID